MAEGTDQAAEQAAAAFWDNNPELDEAAVSEVPDAPRARGGINPGFAQEAQDQHDEQVQAEEEAATAAEAEEKAREAAPTAKQTKQAPEPVAPAEDDAGGLDPVLRDLANEAGWSDEKIDRLYKADPELAVETFEQLADSYANLSRQLIGQAPGTTPAAPAQQPAQVPAQSLTASQLPTLLSDEALTKIANESGTDTANYLKGIRDHFVAQNSALEQRVAKFEQSQQQAEDRVIAQEASKTMTALSEKFPKLYGKGETRTWTVEQFNRRSEIAVMADQMRSGAAKQGRNITVEDAIKRAHYIVSRDSVASEARQELASKVKLRARSVTARPTQRTNPRGVGQGRSDDAAIAAATEKMAEIGFTDDV